MNSTQARLNGSIILKKDVVLAFLATFLYKIVLDLSYCFVISPFWGYTRFYFNPNYLKLIESYLLLFVIFILMPKSKEKLSNAMVWLLNLVSYVPMLTLFALMDQPRAYMYAVTGFWIFVFLLLKLPAIYFSPLKKIQSKIIRYFIFIGFSVMAVFLIYKYLGFSFNFDLTNEYVVREEYVKRGIPLAGYLFNWLAYIINPIFFALFLVKRKWVWIAAIVILQILIFSATGLKDILFALPFVFSLIWITTRKNLLAWMTIGLIAIIMAGMLSYWLMGDLWVSSLFARRTLLVPAQLSFLYYDFFSNNFHPYLSQHHIFQNFLDYPYHLTPPYLVAETYFNDPKMSSNNGIYGDAYMNFGFIGFIFWGTILAIILRLIDSFSKNKDMKITIAAIAMPAIFLTNSALLTCLLTHGLLLALMLLYLLPKKNDC